jgi:pyruvyltransferase
MLKRAKAYWWAEHPNFGDQLAPLLLERFADIKATRATICGSSIVTVGSCLEHIPPEWPGYILGTGALYENSRLHLHTGTATILGVRGPLTAKKCPAGTYMLGDPGLLAPELVVPPYEPDKLYDLGIVPHWTDDHLARDPRFKLDDKWVTRIISPTQDPLSVIRSISHCQKIVTSSLHGMIIADAFGIPRRFEPAPHWSAAEGGMFKFHDYLESIGAPFVVGKMTTVSRLRVEDRRYELQDAYDDLGRQVRKR